MARQQDQDRAIRFGVRIHSFLLTDFPIDKTRPGDAVAVLLSIMLALAPQADSTVMRR